MYRRTGGATGGNTRGRAPVKSQRKVNQQQQPRGPKKHAQKENAARHNAAPIGVSGVPLSNRFSSLQKEALSTHPVPKATLLKKVGAGKKQGGGVVVNVRKQQQQANKPILAARTTKQQQKQLKQQKQLAEQKQKQKMKQIADASRSKRQQTVNQRRQGLASLPSQGAKRAKKPTGKASPQTQKGAAAKLRAKNAKKDEKKKDEKKKAPVTGDDLDMEMDSYWHEGGKGPDPKQAQLDRQMEQYWAEKPKKDGDAGVSDVTTTSS